MSLGNPDRAIGGLAVPTPSGVELRPLGRSDLPEAVALARAQRGVAPLPDADALGERYELLLNSADAAPFLALADGMPAGIGILQFRRRLNFATFEGWVSNLFVAPEARGRGIGRALLAAMIAEWRLRQGHRLQVLSDAGEAACDAALTRAGFTEWMVGFRMSPIAISEGHPPEGVTLRPLGDGDAMAVTRLVAEFGPHRSPVPERMAAVLRTFAAHARAVSTGAAGSLVAELGDRVVGVCVLDWREPFWDLARQAWVHDLVVTEPVRGRGIGKALLAAALRRAREAGAEEVTLESGLRRETAHAMYRSAGFAETGRGWVLQREA